MENMNQWTWNKWYSEAIATIQMMGISTVKIPKTVEKWYQGFRKKRHFLIPLKKHTIYLLS